MISPYTLPTHRFKSKDKRKTESPLGISTIKFIFSMIHKSFISQIAYGSWKSISLSHCTWEFPLSSQVSDSCGLSERVGRRPPDNESWRYSITPVACLSEYSKLNKNVWFNRSFVLHYHRLLSAVGSILIDDNLILETP